MEVVFEEVLPAVLVRSAGEKDRGGQELEVRLCLTRFQI